MRRPQYTLTPAQVQAHAAFRLQAFPKQTTSVEAITDGLSNTILVGEKALDTSAMGAAYSSPWLQGGVEEVRSSLRCAPEGLNDLMLTLR